MKFKELKLDKGWKILVYFDFILPILLFLLAFLIPLDRIKSLFALLFHSYNLYVMNPIPHLASLTGIVGLIYHVGILIYTFRKRKALDIVLTALITLAVVLFFLFELNYVVIKPLSFT